MAESKIDATVIKRTQDSLGKYIKKPPLSEKLLRKPPFRFLFDVFNAIIKETGCFEGLYTPEEQNIDSIKDREDKMKYLQKMIDVIKITTNQALSVRTSKIVAGQEPEKTNELLQFIGEVIEKQLDWKSAVETVVSGKSTKTKSFTSKNSEKSKERNTKSQEKSKEKDTKSHNKTKEKESRSQEKPEKKESRSQEKSKDLRKDKGKEDSKSKSKVTSSDRKAKSEVKPSKDKQNKETKENTSKTAKEDGYKDRSSNSKATSKEKISPSDGRTSETQIKVEAQVNDRNIVASRKPITPPAKLSTVKDTENPGSSPASCNSDTQREFSSKKGTENNNLQTSNTIPTAENNSGESTKLSLNRISSESRSSSGRKQRSSLTKTDDNENGSKHKTTNSCAEPSNSLPGKQDDTTNTNLHLSGPREENPQSLESQKVSESPTNNIKRETTFTRENSIDTTYNRPRTTLRPPSARPASARPGAPRRRDKNVEIILQPNDPIKMSDISVKLETFGDFDDDGENLVILESANMNETNSGETMGSSEMTAAENAENNLGQQGHLVQQILETQKELIQQNDLPRKDEKGREVSSALNTRQNSAKQMNNLRDVIQNLTKSVNPFGKLMDFVPEDIDAMQLELSMWRDLYTQTSNELKKEKNLTESVTEPLKNQLIQIEANVLEYQEIIDASRAKVLQNAEKILKMLTQP